MATIVSDHRKPDHPVDPVFVHRWSPRAMSGEPISNEQLMTLLEAARWAPSSYNEQPWRVMYAKRDTPAWARHLGLLMEANQVWCKNAAVLLLFVSKKTFAKNNKPNPVHVFDCGSAWENLALQGAQMGLVIHGMAGFDVERARKELGVPDDFTVCAMAAIGKLGLTEDLPENLRSIEAPSGRKPVTEWAFEGRFPG